MKLNIDLVELDNYEFVNFIKTIICFYQVQFGRDFEFEQFKEFEKYDFLKMDTTKEYKEHTRNFEYKDDYEEE